MSRIIVTILMGFAAIAFSPSLASAQPGRFYGHSPLYVYPSPGGGWGYGLNFNFGFHVPTPYGPMNIPVIYPYTAGAPSYYAPPMYSPGYSSGYGYLSSGMPNSYDTFGNQMDLAAAQRAAAQGRKNQDEAKELIDAQWDYEKQGQGDQVPAKTVRIAPEELQKAMAVKDELDISSGAALNRILRAIIEAEEKGAKGVAAFVPPQLLIDIRYAGGPVADLLNVLPQTGRIQFPAGFPGPKLEAQRQTLETDFAAVIAQLRTGKPVELAKVQKLETSLKKLEAASPPVIRNLSIFDAVAATRFLHEFDSAIVALKGSNLAGLINPKWASDGTSVSELVKQMAKFKLTFAPALPGGESSYFSLHKAMATYLFVLTNPKK